MKRKRNDPNGGNPNLSCANSAETFGFLASPSPRSYNTRYTVSLCYTQMPNGASYIWETLDESALFTLDIII